eukprot:10808448-Alexandrium_andersonii.AAC.1
MCIRDRACAGQEPALQRDSLGPGGSGAHVAAAPAAQVGGAPCPAWWVGSTSTKGPAQTPDPGGAPRAGRTCSPARGRGGGPSGPWCPTG